MLFFYESFSDIYVRLWKIGLYFFSWPIVVISFTSWSVQWRCILYTPNSLNRFQIVKVHFSLTYPNHSRHNFPGQRKGFQISGRNFQLTTHSLKFPLISDVWWSIHVLSSKYVVKSHVDSVETDITHPCFWSAESQRGVLRITAIDVENILYSLKWSNRCEKIEYFILL